MSRVLEVDEREHKLPVWAQNKLKALRSEVREITHDFVVLSGALGTDCNTWLDGMDRNPKPLGNGARVTFVTKGTDPSETHDVFWARLMQDHHGQPYLEVSGGTGMTIAPRVTNVVEVRLTR